MGLRGRGSTSRAFDEHWTDLLTEGDKYWLNTRTRRENRLIGFCEQLPVPSGILVTKAKRAGEPPPKMTVWPWQQKFIRPIYDPLSEVRTALFTMPRKNGKTGLAAPLVLAHLLGPEAEEMGEIYTAASDREQASIIFRVAKRIIQKTPWMDARTNIKNNEKIIEDLETGSVYRALSSDVETKHGLSPTLVIYDELAQAPNRSLYDVLKSATGGRENPLFIIISTQSGDPTHVMQEQVEYGRAVMSGEIDDPSYYAVIYEAPKDADIFDEDVIRKCNPAIESGFRSMVEIRSEMLQVKKIPSKEPAYRNLYLNQAVTITDNPWMPGDLWKSTLGDYDIEDFIGCPCWGGLDLSITSDLTAFVLVFLKEGKYYAFSFFWAVEHNIAEKEQRDGVPYRAWADKGHVFLRPGKIIDFAHAAEFLTSMCARFQLQAIAYDRAKVEFLNRELEKMDSELPMVPHAQGFYRGQPIPEDYRGDTDEEIHLWMPGAIEETEAAIQREEFHANRNPCLTWCVSNATCRMSASDPNDRCFEKIKKTGRIDGATALVQAMNAARHVEADLDRFEDMNIRFV